MEINNKLSQSYASGQMDIIFKSSILLVSMKNNSHDPDTKYLQSVDKVSLVLAYETCSTFEERSPQKWETSTRIWIDIEMSGIEASNMSHFLSW